MNNDKILITGGAGFIGFNFAKMCIRKGFKVFNIDTLSYSANYKEIRNLKNKNHYFYNLNINDKKIMSILKKNKILKIIHFAAESHVDNSIKKPKFFFENNCISFIDFVNNLNTFYKGLNKHDKKLFRFINISTDEVYGSLKLNEKSFTEKSLINPQNPYAASKASAELYLQSFANTYDFPYITTNCSNNYGEYQNDEKLIPTIFRNALHNKKIPIYGNGKNIREWIHVKDHNEAILLILDKGENFNKYNIGSKFEFTNLSLAKKICKILDKKIPKKIKYENQIIFVEDRAGHDFRYSINSDKIKKRLAWKAKIDINEGLNQISNYYINKYLK